MGGTIDKDYPRSTKGWAFEISDPAVHRVLEKVRPPGFEAEVVSVCKKDSMEIDDDDRRALLRACSDAAATRIIVTHGTDTLVQTAQFVQREAAAEVAAAYRAGATAGSGSLAGKVVVFTGAMRPEKFTCSDAPFNVGTAVGAANVCAPGVYVCMGGRVFECDRVTRNLETGEFIDKVA